ncbi:MAG TPA: FMN-binding protein [Micromonosporaceae bacterium]
MRRVTLAILATIVSTTLLIGLKAQGALPTDLVAQTPADPEANPSRTPAKAGPTRTAGPAARATPATPGAATSTSGATKPASTGTSAPARRTIIGTAVAAVWHGENYGDMQVKIIVTGTHIDDIITIQESNRPGAVSTTLRAQALSAQSANVGNVSGATASSIAYKQSLQSAISKI